MRASLGVADRRIATAIILLPSQYTTEAGQAGHVTWWPDDEPILLHQVATRSLGVALLTVALALSSQPAGTRLRVLVAFQTEQQAQAHCPNDTVVWVNPQSGTYFLKDGASYGRAGIGR